MENLNAEQVKKALECCYDCRCSADCLFYDEDHCFHEMLGLAISLIKELTEEVEDLKVTLLARTMALTTLKAVKKELTEDKEKLGYLTDELVKEKRELWEENKKLTEENERLRAENKALVNENAELKNQIQEEISEEDLDLFDEFTKLLHEGIREAKADTVRKMQQRLKADAVTIQDHTGKLGVVVGVGNIDDVAREMLEGETDGDK